MLPRSRAVRRAVSGLGQRACARAVTLLGRTASCDARHGDVHSWGREDAAAAVAAARARSQTRYRGGGSGAATPGSVPSLLRSPLLPLPSAVVPEESETYGEAARSSGWGSLECERRFRGEEGEPGVEKEVRALRGRVSRARAGERALRPSLQPGLLTWPARCAVARGADREGPGAALLSTAFCGAWRPPHASPLPALRPEHGLSSSPLRVQLPFLTAHRENLPSLSSFLSLLLISSRNFFGGRLLMGIYLVLLFWSLG